MNLKYWDDSLGWIVPNKVNRLYMFPLTLGIQQYVLTEYPGRIFKTICGGWARTYILFLPIRTTKIFSLRFGYHRVIQDLVRF